MSDAIRVTVDVVVELDGSQASGWGQKELTSSVAGSVSSALAAKRFRYRDLTVRVRPVDAKEGA